jgi:hypothetical protein
MLHITAAVGGDPVPQNNSRDQNQFQNVHLTTVGEYNCQQKQHRKICIIWKKTDCDVS